MSSLTLVSKVLLHIEVNCVLLGLDAEYSIIKNDLATSIFTLDVIYA